MEIARGSKWQHKDGGVYEVDSQSCIFLNYNMYFIPIVWYKDQQGKIYVRAEKHFLDSFKPYKPVYEYQWAYKSALEPLWNITSYFATDEEANNFTRARELQRLDFTKRERK